MQEKLLEQFKNIRSQTEKICAPLHVEDYVVQPIIDVSPPKWHLAHTSWFILVHAVAAFELYNFISAQFVYSI